MFKVRWERIFSTNLSLEALFASYSHLIQADSQLLQAGRLRYSHLIRVENGDVLKRGSRCFQAGTGTEPPLRLNRLEIHRRLHYS